MKFEIKNKYLIVKTAHKIETEMLKECGGAMWVPKGKYFLFPFNTFYLERFIDTFNVKSPAIKNIIESCVKRDRYCSHITAECDYYRTHPSALTPIDSLGSFADRMDHHQKVALYKSMKMDRFGVFLDTGTGKSKVLIDNITLRFLYGQAKRVLIVCPKLNINRTWIPEIAKHSKLSIPTTIIRGSAKEKTLLLQEENREYYLHICTYGSLDTYQKFMPVYDIVVFDESRSYMANDTSDRSMAALELSASAKYVLLATGTVNTIKNMRDVFTQYKVKDLGATFGLRYVSFLEKYFIDVGKNFPLWIIKKDCIEIVHNWMFLTAITYTKEECLDLPDRTEEEVLIEPTRFQKKFADLFADGFDLARPDPEFEKFFESNGLNYLKEADAINECVPFSKIIKLQEISNGFYKPFTDSKNIIRFTSSKLKNLPGLIETMPNHKIIIWCRFREDILSIQNILKKAKISSYAIHGNKDEVEKWQSSKSANVLVAMEQIGKGFTLIEASVVIYFSISYSFDELKQSRDRNYRRGQTKKVTEIMYQTQNSVDQAVLKIVKGSASFSKKLTASRLKKIARGQ